MSLPGQLGLGLTVAGVGMAFLSTFAAYSLMLLGRALGRAAESGGEGAASKGQVVGRLVKMCYVNVIGMGATVAGAEAVIGLLVGKSLTSATTALFQNGMYNYQPVLPLDIFLVQVSPPPPLPFPHPLSPWLAPALARVLTDDRARVGSQPTRRASTPSLRTSWASSRRCTSCRRSPRPSPWPRPPSSPSSPGGCGFPPPLPSRPRSPVHPARAPPPRERAGACL